MSPQFDEKDIKPLRAANTAAQYRRAVEFNAREQARVAVMESRAATFQLIRHEDITGVSGTGVIADGVVWPDGTASIRWRGEKPSVVFWQGGIEDVIEIHGHHGATSVVFN